MLVWVEIGRQYLIFFIIPFQGKERTAKTSLMPAKLCVRRTSKHGVRTLTHTARSRTPRCLSQRGVEL